MSNRSSHIKNIPPLEPPCRKTIYQTLEEAQDMIRYIQENRETREIRPYKCSICGFWHLTHKPGAK